MKKKPTPTANDLLEMLKRRPDRLLDFAPTFLANERRTVLVEQMVKPDTPTGMVAQMVCAVLAEQLGRAS